MLVAKNLTKKIGELEILKGINLEINQGEIVSIVGASGAGKTTLLQILGTLDKPSAGEIFIEDINPFSLNSNNLANFRNTKIGFVFQFHQLLPEFNALENVMMPALIGGSKHEVAKEKAFQLLDMLRLKDRISHQPSALSGGEQQRVAVARALINDPKIIFADEPSGNLDGKNAAELHQLFFELREKFNQSFVIVTHNSDLAKMADRTLRIVDGKVEM